MGYRDELLIPDVLSTRVVTTGPDAAPVNQGVAVRLPMYIVPTGGGWSGTIDLDGWLVTGPTSDRFTIPQGFAPGMLRISGSVEGLGQGGVSVEGIRISVLTDNDPISNGIVSDLIGGPGPYPFVVTFPVTTSTEVSITAQWSRTAAGGQARLGYTYVALDWMPLPEGATP